jgi:DNA replication protein DnaC
MKRRIDITQDLIERLRELHLPAIRESFVEEAEKARKESSSYEAYLRELVQHECDMRSANRVTRLLRESQVPMEKSWAGFDRKRLPRKVAQQVEVLLDGTFLDRKENVLAFGNPGSGKTHLLCAIGQELIRLGRRVLFMPCSLLVQELLVAKRDLRLARTLKRLGRYDALIIDDIGYVQQDREEMEVLFSLLAARYERGSVMVTSNLPFSKWEAIFKDPMTTAAAIDRLVHHSVILELNLPSYRLEQSKKSATSAKESVSA